MKRLALAAVVLPALLAVACSQGFSSDSGADRGATSDAGLTRHAEAGGVAVEGTWLTARELDRLDADVDAFRLDEFVLVKIQFTTHSGDLNRIDMEQAAVLRQGEADEQPKGWISLSDDSHHRAGVLVFSRHLEGGPAELSIDLGDEELVLLWETAPRA